MENGDAITETRTFEFHAMDLDDACRYLGSVRASLPTHTLETITSLPSAGGDSLAVIVTVTID